MRGCRGGLLTPGEGVARAASRAPHDGAIPKGIGPLERASRSVRLVWFVIGLRYRAELITV